MSSPAAMTTYKLFFIVKLSTLFAYLPKHNNRRRTEAFGLDDGLAIVAWRNISSVKHFALKEFDK